MPARTKRAAKTRGAASKGKRKSGTKASRASKAHSTSTKSKRKSGDKASEMVESAMHELKRGTLRSSSGQKVTSRAQAIAIGLSQARRAGGKVPRRRGS